MSLYQSSLPAILKHLNNLSVILDKAVANATERQIDPHVFINARLAPDMFPLVRQVQMVSDNAKGCAARLSGQDIPSYADTEKTFPELQDRLAKTIAFVKSVTPEQVDGHEDRIVTVKTKGGEKQLAAADYLFGFALPNFYFHATIAYAILRHQGVPVGKLDYLGAY